MLAHCSQEMPGLRKLQFVIDDCRWLGKVSIDGTWLGPLKEVRGLGRFDLGSERGWTRMQITGTEHELRFIMCANREKQVLLITRLSEPPILRDFGGWSFGLI